jgi:hypothetical protein
MGRFVNEPEKHGCFYQASLPTGSNRLTIAETILSRRDKHIV